MTLENEAITTVENEATQTDWMGDLDGGLGFDPAALTSKLPFSGWGGVFGDQAVAAAMIDRVVHHADVLTLKGASCRLRNRGIETLPSIKTQDRAD